MNKGAVVKISIVGIVLILVGLGYWIISERNRPANKMKRTVEKLTQSCPIEYDEFTRVDSIRMKGLEKVSFYCTYISDKENVNYHAVKRFIQYKRSTDIIVNPTLKLFRDKLLTIEFVYFDKNKNSFTEVIVEPRDYVSTVR
jgi:hypothetical protein